MKNAWSRSFKLVWFLLALSLSLYFIDFLLFGHPDDIGAGFFGNLAFLPIYVLFVTLMVERSFKERERLALRRKLNMVIGVFFSEVGSGLLCELPLFLQDSQPLRERLHVTPQWGKRDFQGAAQFLKLQEPKIVCRLEKLPELKRFLVERRPFMLGLLENPNLLEHDEFTDLLWAVFHLIEELQARHDVTKLSAADQEHLAGDLKRVYSHLTMEWLSYMQHLKEDYPYLYSLAVRMNPLNPEARAEIS